MHSGCYVHYLGAEGSPCLIPSSSANPLNASSFEQKLELFVRTADFMSRPFRPAAKQIWTGGADWLFNTFLP